MEIAAGHEFKHQAVMSKAGDVVVGVNIVTLSAGTNDKSAGIDAQIINCTHFR